MAEAAEAAEVGPMAAVAGALADLAVDVMLRCGARLAVVENGGEVAAKTDRPIYVAILSANPSISGKMSFEITDVDCPIGIATSSSRFGHALSFGNADSVTVVADRASIADAAATSICNAVPDGRFLSCSVLPIRIIPAGHESALTNQAGRGDGPGRDPLRPAPHPESKSRVLLEKRLLEDQNIRAGFEPAQ